MATEDVAAARLRGVELEDKKKAWRCRGSRKGSQALAARRWEIAEMARRLGEDLKLKQRKDMKRRSIYIYIYSIYIYVYLYIV